MQRHSERLFWLVLTNVIFFTNPPPLTNTIVLEQCFPLVLSHTNMHFDQLCFYFHDIFITFTNLVSCFIHVKKAPIGHLASISLMGY